ncbi:membrane protein FAM174B [Strongylocentrotus purpuratus]|uniref:Uncharacterized protein n=1 Tax=Strongylocentrotus purpuratus TaxID=7668 RepID=A0A7M7HK54_STRPU|nr:membrane protein FAM174B [Strongylocentrotus purpuratus]|eukprot:XP_011671945.1 PREDICTED: membrane protein FAM174B isoform X1 [Strongylocentrotus purpuratus]
MGDKIMSTAFWRVPFLFNTNITKLFNTLLYFMIGILSWQLDLALAVDPVVPPVAPGPGQAVAGTTNRPPGTSSGPTTAKSVVANDTSSQDGEQFEFGDVLYDKSMLRRSFFVLIGFTCLAVMFFAVRWFRSRGKRKSKKYGVLATRSSDMELRPLDQEDDEEDMTVFDVNSK